MRLLHHYVHLAEIELVKPRNMAAFLSRVNLNTVMIYTELCIDDLERRLERVELGDGRDVN